MFSGRVTPNICSPDSLGLLGITDQAQEADEAKPHPSPAHGIDDLSASLWVGLYYRYDFLLHYKHELLE